MAFSTKRDYRNETKITGTITRTFGVPKEDWTAGVLRADTGDPLECDCRFRVQACLTLGEQVTLSGVWTNDPKWGWQFAAAAVEYPEPDATPGGLAKYLATDTEFTGIGVVKAQLIADAFPDNFDEAIRDDPEAVATAGKLTPEDAENLQSVWCKRADTNTVSTWLAQYDISPHMISKIVKLFGSATRTQVKQNPYCLQDVDGIGFLKADIIALRMDIDPLSPFRLQAGIRHFLNEMHDNEGHTYVKLETLQAEVIKKLYLDAINSTQLVQEQIEQLVTYREIAHVVIKDCAYVGLEKLRAKELYILERLRATSKEVDSENYAFETDFDTESAEKIQLTAEQQQAVDYAGKYLVSVITGGAGTGKSHVIASIVKQFRQTDLEVSICAPTGIAARRLTQGETYAQTIHKLLGVDFKTGGFVHNAKNLLNADAVIVDEVSMCSIPLLYSLFSALRPHCKIVLVGDSNQLPPIGAGNTLRDLCSIGTIAPITMLTKCHRNAGILKENCKHILSGKMPRTMTPVDSSILPKEHRHLSDDAPQWDVIQSAATPQDVVDLLEILWCGQLDQWHYNPIVDVQIITPQRKGDLGTNRLNQILQWLRLTNEGHKLPCPSLFDKPKILLGDKVMQIRNNYAFLGGLMNGTQGIVTKFAQVHSKCRNKYSCNSNYNCEDCKYKEGKPAEHMFVQFADRDNILPINTESDEINDLVLAYAVTVHKVQGAQYPCVIFVCSKSHTYMLSRNLLYTAVTRARISAIILGDAQGINRALATQADAHRNTWTRLMYTEERQTQ